MTTSCRFEVCEDAGEYQVRAFVDGEDPIAEPFDLSAFTTGALRDIISRLDGQGGCDKNDIKRVGTELWNALRAGKIRERLDRIEQPYPIFLKVPETFEVSRLPWEALWDENRKRYLGCDDRRSLLRVISEAGFTPNEPIRSGSVRMLVIVPRGCKLNVGKEIATLSNLPLRLGEENIEVRTLTARVTATDLRDVLKEAEWDILHFIGHSRFSRAKGVEIRLNGYGDAADDAAWLDPNQFAEILAGSKIRLAVFNSCESALSESSVLDGLGQQLAMVAGIPAIAVMRYEIDDNSAGRFSDEFYRTLFDPRHPGQVDLAMQAARQWLYYNASDAFIRSFITPVLYQAVGTEIFPASRIKALSRRPAMVEAEDRATVDVPSDLVERLKRGVCVPIIGPGIHPPASRRQAGTKTLIDLLHELAKEGGYPDQNEIMAADTVPELCSLLLPRIFQHFSDTNDPEKLIVSLQTCCGLMEVPAVLRRVAAWRVPGIVYTHIDGLMQEALKAAGRAMRVVNIADRPLAASADTTRDDGALTLFNLRGSLDEAESLVLTDTDHDVLLHGRLEHANTDVVNLFKKVLGRTVLFVGVSPLDPAVRRLARLFLESPRRIQGPRYFVVQHASAGDRAYWKDLDVEWIESDPSAVIETLDARVRP